MLPFLVSSCFTRIISGLSRLHRGDNFLMPVKFIFEIPATLYIPLMQPPAPE